MDKEGIKFLYLMEEEKTYQVFSKRQQIGPYSEIKDHNLCKNFEVREKKEDILNTFTHSTQLKDDVSQKTTSNHEKKLTGIREDVSSTILACFNCKKDMFYENTSLFVSCPYCKTINPTHNLLALNCQFCKLVSYFPKGSSTVQCTCGAIFQVS